jgi:vanillate O-demethylase ferredoxin subunit
METKRDPWQVDSCSFEIYLAWSETTLTVAPGESALDVLLAAGVPIEPGCKSGACGMCATDFVEGDVIHKDVYLNPAERENTFCPCVSRAHTRIVLAL